MTTPLSPRKLVRDNIPGIIRASGRVPVVRILPDEEYRDALDDKLAEEVSEYLSARRGDASRTEELADICDVIEAILNQAGISPDEFGAVRRLKKERAGGFEKKIWLERIE